ncbi:TniQ family protein [Peribacillus frigoritolerans]|uniref:hypothetical protein n=1 Tax=Peribacillus frigoritolerans TaxID=450367 RepID=UPI0037F3C510
MIKYDYTWNKHWILQHESFYSIIEKFKLTNSIEGKNVLDLLECVKPRERNFITLHEDISNEKMINVFGYPLRHIIQESINSLIYPLKIEKHRLNKFFANNLRYCPKCFERYYHSILHQFLLLTKCPLHEIPLHEKCPNCLQKIKYNITENQPFSCNCGYKFIKNGLNFAHFLAEMKRNKHFNKYDLFTNKLLKKYVSDKDIVIYIDKISLPTSDHDGDMISKIYTMNETSRCNYKIFYLNRKGPVKKSSEELNREIFLNTKATYKSIARYIRKNLLKKHRKCIRQTVKFKIENNTCKKAMSYIFWRMLIEDLCTFSLVDNGSQKRGGRYDHSLSFISDIDHNTLEELYFYLSRNFPDNERIILDLINKYSALLLFKRYKSICSFFESRYEKNSLYNDLIAYSYKQTNIILTCKKDDDKQILKFLVG